ncbi:2-C-methyl-D-erythritol 4-phosphate cytidylyltransferase [Lachnoclostridium sp. Marseille-P6806]|uniref:2-C-methyl-D-erythritol 4-phosphate cytidylyltransferase n=1 Tax=Lachnoclostridium sp. Marseille-P6806 TaxID=2364793 RepID=UPI001031BBC1|nr:2-C-methyl-D-erythritol 4-phosphate cytidylyltransferase [Lachnoclostridium sp. Marseille-P6806]
MKKRVTAILLAAGKGSRMNSGVRKQYMQLGGRPVLAWPMETLENSAVITDIVVVVPEGEESYIREHVLPAVRLREDRAPALRGGNENRRKEKGGALPPVPASKLRAFAAGGAERCHSVYSGLQSVSWPCDYVFIHDGARPFLTESVLLRLYETVLRYDTAVAGMPSKDTVKLTDENGIVRATPDRQGVWMVQTPQCFAYDLAVRAYERVLGSGAALPGGMKITDDAMVVEYAGEAPVHMVEADYRNIKLTTPEDLIIGEAFLRESRR